MAGKPRVLPPGVMLKSEYAKHRGCAPSRVTALIQEGKLTAPALRPDGTIDVARADMQLGPSQQQMLGVAPMSSGPQISEADDEASYAVSRARREKANAEKAELDLATTKGELIERAAAERAYEDLARGLADRILKVPAQISADLARLGDEAAIATHLLAALRASMVEYHDAL